MFELEQLYMCEVKTFYEKLDEKKIVEKEGQHRKTAYALIPDEASSNLKWHITPEET